VTLHIVVVIMGTVLAVTYDLIFERKMWFQLGIYNFVTILYSNKLERLTPLVGYKCCARRWKMGCATLNRINLAQDCARRWKMECATLNRINLAQDFDFLTSRATCSCWRTTLFDGDIYVVLILELNTNQILFIVLNHKTFRCFDYADLATDF